MSVTNVTVHLGVTVDATGNVSVFGEAAVSQTNVIVAATTLPSGHLYKGKDDSLIRFKGPAAAPNTIYAELHSAFAANKAALKTALAAIILGAFDCSGATPYNSGYSAADNYWQRTSFGHVALGAYAHDLFGHVAATAAIDNDTVFISKMNGILAGDANIAGLLSDAVYLLNPEKSTVIAKQVIGQDASRAMGEDNDEYSPDLYQALEFKAGDVVYMSVNLLAPTVSVSNAAQQSAPSTVAARTYVLKMTVSL
jgi:hypothetical protein